MIVDGEGHLLGARFKQAMSRMDSGGSARLSNSAAGIPHEWWAAFEAAGRRPLAVRMRYAFIRTYKPVLDDATYRSFDSLEDYRRWCEANLPDWLGYGRV